MWNKSSHSLARWALASLAVVLAACSGGEGDDRAEPRRTSPTTAAPVTTVAPASIDLDHPIPGGSLHGTPRPPLENTGDDYVAITRSLIANFRWLTENPDPTVISELYVPGTEQHDHGIANVQELVDHGWRAQDENYLIVSIEIVDTRPGLASIRVADSMDFEQIVDSDGSRVGTGRVREPKVKTWSVLLTTDQGQRWRIADFSPGLSP
jgi:hypothetical protein